MINTYKKLLTYFLIVLLVVPNNYVAKAYVDTNIAYEDETSLLASPSDSKTENNEENTATETSEGETTEEEKTETSTEEENDSEESRDERYILAYKDSGEEQVSFVEPRRVVDGEAPRQRSVSIPAKYTNPYLTGVRDQNPFGSCWAHAVCAASEMNAVKKGIANSSIDLSELQLAYFVNKRSVVDPLGLTKGDSFSIKIEQNFLDDGGNQDFAMRRLANWVGYASEDKAGYEIARDLYVENNISGTNRNIESLFFSESLAYDDVLHLENGIIINMGDISTVKNVILEFGACSSAYYHRQDYYNEKNAAYYCPEDLYTNHAITVVGWDDNYSRDNFGKMKPSRNGAWYVKNSWGDWFGNNGYFWISYEDASVLGANGYAFDVAPADNYDNNYHYDGGVGKGYYGGPYEASIFKAASKERLEAVGLYTADSNYDCNIKIYKHLTERIPTKGELVYEGSIHYDYAGYHTYKLNNSINLEQGELFSVVVKHSAANVKILVDCDNNGSWYSNTSSSNKGQSFVSKSGTSWQDIGVADEKNGNYGVDDTRLKAFTCNMSSGNGLSDKDKYDSDSGEIIGGGSSNPITSIKLNKYSSTLFVGDKMTLVASVVPVDTTSDKTITFVSSNSKIAKVDAKGVVTAVAEGKTTITAISSNGKEASCIVVVKKIVIPITGVKMNTTATVYTGEAINLSATVIPSDTTQSKNITYKTSNPSIALVNNGVVQGIATGSVTITATSSNGLYAKCTVTVKKKEIPITDVTLNSRTATINMGNTVKLVAKISPSNTTQSTNVTWSSSNTNVATVSSSGVVTGKKAGSATITVKTSNGKKTTCTVKVNKIPITGITLNKTAVTVNIRKKISLIATIKPSNTTDSTKITWSSSSKSVATVSSMGVVTGLKPGITTITAKTSNGKTAKCKVTVTVPDVTVSYMTHIQSFGWEKQYKTNGQMSGTTGLAKRLEAIKIKVSGNADLGITYSTHCQTYGWLGWSSNNAMNGTSGEAKRLEAIQIKLTGKDKDYYDVYYRVHAQSYGWLGWAKNGASSGTAGYAKRLEGIQIVVVKKGASFNKNMGGITSKYSKAFIKK